MNVEVSHTYNIESIAVHNSSAGSLVNYLLGITQVDPIKHGLLFSRFLSKERVEFPDIDCLDSMHLVLTNDGLKRLHDIKIGDFVYDINNELKEVKYVSKRKSDYTDVILEVIVCQNEGVYGSILCNSKHKFFLDDRTVVKANELKLGDCLYTINSYIVTVVEIKILHGQYSDLVDLTIADTSSFNVIPFDARLDCHGSVNSNLDYNYKNNDSWLSKGFSLTSHNCDVSDRDLLIRDLREHFGENNVLYISNYNTLKLKSLIKDISRFYNIPLDEVNAVTKVVEEQVKDATQKQGDDKNLFELKFEDAMEHSHVFKSFIEKYPLVSENMLYLHKQIKSTSTHASGVLILENPERCMPVISVRGDYQSPWVEGLTLKTLEALGFLKFDILGLNTLRIMQRCISYILRKDSKRIRFNFDGNYHSCRAEDFLLTTDNNWIKASDITENDDIVVPFVTKDVPRE